MKDLVIGSGEVVTQKKFIELNSGGDDQLTEFLATEQDVRTLANGLVRELLGQESYMSECCGRLDIYDRDYLEARLDRVLDFKPELVDSIEEKLRVGRAKIELSQSPSGSAPKNAGCPNCFSPLERQRINFYGRVGYTVRTTSEGGWEPGELTDSRDPYMEFHSFHCPD